MWNNRKDEAKEEKNNGKKEVEVDDVGVVSVIHFFFRLPFFSSFRYFFINLMVVDVEL